MRKVLMITGASRGIGKATALAFARAGYDVAITARTETEGQVHAHSLATAAGEPLPGSLATTAAGIVACGVRALPVPMDLLDTASVDAAADRVLHEFGRVDVLINNAIYQGPDLNAMFLDLEEATLERVWRAYVSSPVRLTRRIVSAMLRQGGGTVINVTSGAGERDPELAADQGGWGFAYGAGKAAVSRLAGVIVTELGRRGIRAFTVNPGVVATEALKVTIGEDGALAARFGAAPPEVPAAAMLWLATNPEAEGLQRRTLSAQSLVRERGILPDWRNPPQAASSLSGG